MMMPTYFHYSDLDCLNIVIKLSKVNKYLLTKTLFTIKKHMHSFMLLIDALFFLSLTQA